LEHGACITLGPKKAYKCVRGGDAWHDGLSGLVVVCAGHGGDVCSCHVTSVGRGVHSFVYVADWELCNMGFEGGKAVAKDVGRWRVVRGRLRTYETAERRTWQIWPSRMSRWESLKRPS
jgi:hypothetical protein